MTKLFNSLTLIILLYRVNCDLPLVNDIAGGVLGEGVPNTAGTADNGGGLSLSVIDNKQSLGSVGGSKNDLGAKDKEEGNTPIMASSYAMQPMMQPMMIQPIQQGSTLQASGSANGGYQYPVMCDPYNQCYQVYSYGYGQYPTSGYNTAPYYSGSAYNPTGYPQYYTTM
jgi:hypothetical protein